MHTSGSVTHEYSSLFYSYILFFKIDEDLKLVTIQNLFVNNFTYSFMLD